MSLGGMPRISAEFRLLVETCRQAFAGADPDRLIDLGQGVDWPLFLALARRHRVQGLAAHSLRGTGPLVPAGIADDLAADARSIALQGMRGVAECRRLLDAFDQEGTPLLFVKGLTVGRLAYDNPFLKMGWDIDLLVAPASVSRASSTLTRLGYRCITPATPHIGTIVRWHQHSKESVWRNAAGSHVELHSRLADNARTIPTLTVAAPQQWVDVTPDARLPTLAPTELFAYLAVHGGSSNWFRLKWLADFAGVMRDRGPAELVALVRSGQKLGAGRSIAQAMLLCAELFGGAFQVAAAELKLGEDRSDRWLARSALIDLAGPRSLGEPTDRRFGTARIHLGHLLTQPGIGYAVDELRRKIAERIVRPRFP